MDVTDRKSISLAFNEAESQIGTTINCLINNAGIANPKLSLDLEEDDWEGLLNTNLRGAFFVSQEACKRMVRDKIPGQVVNVASILGLRVGTSQVNYGAAKAGLLHMSKTMAAELGRNNIRINSICPGYFETEMNTEFSIHHLVKHIYQGYTKTLRTIIRIRWTDVIVSSFFSLNIDDL